MSDRLREAAKRVLGSMSNTATSIQDAPYVRSWYDELDNALADSANRTVDDVYYDVRHEPRPSDAAQPSLWQRALDLIEWANDLRMGSRPDVGEWTKERRAFHDAILAHPEDTPQPDNHPSHDFHSTSESDGECTECGAGYDTEKARQRCVAHTKQEG